MAIDMHSYCYPETLVEALKVRFDLTYIKPDDDGTHTLSHEGTDALVRPGYTDFGPCMDDLDMFGVDTHVVPLAIEC